MHSFTSSKSRSRDDADLSSDGVSFFRREAKGNRCEKLSRDVGIGDHTTPIFPARADLVARFNGDR